MKKVIVGLVVVMVLGLSVGVFAFQNEPEGFRGLKWGDPPLPEMVETFTDKGVVGYRRISDKLQMGSVPLDSITYIYVSNKKLATVIMFFKGESNFKTLGIICKEKFGSPTNEGWNDLKWMSKGGSVMLGYDILEDHGSLALASFVITMEAVEADKDRESKEAELDW